MPDTAPARVLDPHDHPPLVVIERQLLVQLIDVARHDRGEATTSLTAARAEIALHTLTAEWWGSECTDCGEATAHSMRCEGCGMSRHTKPLFMVLEAGAS